MVKKVVALETCRILGITKGKEYIFEVRDEKFYTIVNDLNRWEIVYKKRFKPLEEEMEIKVGSEWVSENGNGAATVKYVGDHKVFIKWNEDGSEGERFKESFLKNFKPKPTRRTVWLNVYKGMIRSHTSKFEADMNCVDGLLWQQKVELIDPREGEVNA